MENLFNESDFALFAKYQGKTQNEAPEGFEKLRGLYDKLGVVLEELNRIGYHTQINRNPLIQGGSSVMKYSSYHWAKIYPKDNSHYKECDGKVFVVIGTTEDGIDIHLDSNSRKGHNSDKNEITKNLKNDTWCQIEPFEAAKYTTVELAQKVNEFFQDNWVEFNQFAKEFGIQKSIEILKNMDILKITQLLTTNRNLILNGAPGTGKTYLAKQIAKSMGCTDNEIGFVQFHPSYDYTDFVEGLRPAQDKSGNVGFVRKDGVFKAFCRKALKNVIDSKKTPQELKNEKTFKEKYDEIIGKIENGEIDRFDLRTGVQMDVVEVSEKDNIILRTHGSDKQYTVSFGRLSQLAKKFPDVASLNSITNIDKTIRDVIKGCHTSSYWAVLKAIYEQCSSDENEIVPNEVEEKKYVFIIDEINRGEISKIFGELFFSIDPGYRGIDGKVRTQYANMQTDPNVFDEALGINDSYNCGHFFVPENVYIIGTMNDIDRSVESMDFAFRRRFAFKEITAEESKQMLDSENAWGKDENGNSRKPDQVDIDIIKSKMDAINNVIWHKVKEDVKDEDKSIEGLSSAYHIGASYFLKLVNYKNTDGSYDFDQLWENHLEGLLREYLRGMQNLEEKLKTLKAAYDNESDSDSGQQQE